MFSLPTLQTPVPRRRANSARRNTKPSPSTTPLFRLPLCASPVGHSAKGSGPPKSGPCSFSSDCSLHFARTTFWGSIAEDYAAVGPPTGFQGLISWLFLPAVAAGMYFNAPGEYLYIGAALFTIVFAINEIDKPSEPHNFEPQIYNMERGSRDKLISDYNTMDLWDFNEKYGELWDFTVEHDEIVKR